MGDRKTDAADKDVKGGAREGAGDGSGWVDGQCLYYAWGPSDEAQEAGDAEGEEDEWRVLGEDEDGADVKLVYDANEEGGGRCVRALPLQGLWVV